MTLSDFHAPHIVSELPGPKSRATIELDERFTSPSLTRPYPLVVNRARGTVVEDMDGNRFLDFAAGIAVCSTGHCHPRVVTAIKEQAERLIHICGSDFYFPAYAELSARLAELAPGDDRWRVFLGNSGTEAVEGAIKLARYHTGRQHIIAFTGSFHGRTLGSLSLTSSKITQRAKFGPLLPAVSHAPFGDLRFIEEQIFKRLVAPEEVAAIVVEPIQGEGGYLLPPDGFLQGLRALCDRHGILLVADEVQSGMGRTGRMFAVDHWGVVPDILLLAKGIASGMPLGAIVAREEIMNWQPGAHGSTFGGNPLACVAALETIKLLEEGLVAHARELGSWFIGQLRELAKQNSLLADVRGMGLMIGVDFKSETLSVERAHELRDEIAEQCFRRGLILLSCGESAIRFAPPLTVSQEETEGALNIFSEVLREIEGREGR